jgi:hypothetical protein
VARIDSSGVLVRPTMIDSDDSAPVVRRRFESRRYRRDESAVQQA